MIALLSFVSFAHAFAAPPAADVRATLADGQVLHGDVRTRTLRLLTGAGAVEVPLDDVGEVRPAGADLQGAEGLVDVWLRNGSELRGRWEDPRLAVDVSVGGRDVTVNLPMDELARFQLQGGAHWPTGPVYRLRTAWGDDFLVDPARTAIVLENHLGTFAPKLAECRSVAPVGDPTGPWRIELQTGTVLIGELRDDAVTVALPMGPEAMTVPLASFVSLRVESWGPPRAVASSVTAAPGVLGAAPKRGVAAESAEDVWFDNAALAETKRQNDE